MAIFSLARLDWRRLEASEATLTGLTSPPAKRSRFLERLVPDVPCVLLVIATDWGRGLLCERLADAAGDDCRTRLLVEGDFSAICRCDRLAADWVASACLDRRVERRFEDAVTDLANFVSGVILDLRAVDFDGC